MIASRACHRATARKFQPLHRESCGFPSPVGLFSELGVREWFAPLRSRAETGSAKRYCVEKEALTLPTFALQVMDRRAAGTRQVYDLAVDDLHAFVAGTVAVHNCIGNSGPLPEPVAEAVPDEDLVVVAVLSGNRNFEGRIHPQVRASYLASPPLVVAYALAGSVDIDLTTEPLGDEGRAARLPARHLADAGGDSGNAGARRQAGDLPARVRPCLRRRRALARAATAGGGQRPLRLGPQLDLRAQAHLLRRHEREPAPLRDITGARVLVSVGDSVTTDHISPAGSIPTTSPAGQYLIEHGVAARDFNSYGSRRGNHEVMVRGTFANIRLRNALVPGKEGYWTTHLPAGEEMTIYDASMRYQAEGTPLIVLAGKEYGSGSSRDWAAKGPLLLGIRATIAESYERIHRSNLVGMGILPLQFKPGESREALGLNGRETFDILGVTGTLQPRQEITVRATREDGSRFEFTAIARLDSAIDIAYYRNGGILLTVLRRLLRDQRAKQGGSQGGTQA